MLILIIILFLILLVVLSFVENNLHEDDHLMNKVWKAGFKEKQAKLPDGGIINYGEGGFNNKTPLMLIHGQGQAWQDYDKVLPELSKEYHVFSVDCYGHGKSSHDKNKYTLKKIKEDYTWFIRNIIGAPCVISGHSSGGIIASNIAATSKDDILALLIEDSPLFCVTPQEMQDENAIVWTDSFKLFHDYLNQDKTKCLYEYYLQNSIIFGMFGNFKNKMTTSAKKYSIKHPNTNLRISFIPQTLLRGLYYIHNFDLDFSEKFYDGTWFDGVSQEEILKQISCPCIYIKAKTGYMLDKKFVFDINEKDAGRAYLCCANSEKDAQKVVSLIKNCKRVNTDSNAHLIHYKYPKIFINELLSLKK